MKKTLILLICAVISISVTIYAGVSDELDTIESMVGIDNSDKKIIERVEILESELGIVEYEKNLNERILGIKDILGIDSIDTEQLESLEDKSETEEIESGLLVNTDVEPDNKDMIHSSNMNYESRVLTECLTCLSEDDSSMFIDSTMEELFPSGDGFYLDIKYVGDNGALVGIVHKSLFVIKDGDLKIVAEDASSYLLSALGNKLVYVEDGSYNIVSYDIGTHTSKIINHGDGNYRSIYAMSYDGNVIMLSGSEIIIGDRDAIWYPFADFVGSDNLAERVFFNDAFISRQEDLDGNVTGEGRSVNFSVVDLSKQDPENHNLPGSDLIAKSESIYCKITAHNEDYSEIIYSYGGDSYYFSKEEKKRLTVESELYPVESLHNIKYFREYQTAVNSFLNGDDISIGTSASDLCDTSHGINKIKNNIYCSFNRKNGVNESVSLISLSDDLNIQPLVSNIITNPLIVKNGTGIWALTKSNIYYIDISNEIPLVSPCSTGDFSPYERSATPLQADLTSGDLLYIANSYLGYNSGDEEDDCIIHGDLCSIDKNGNTIKLASDVSWYIVSSDNRIYYVANVDDYINRYDSIGTLYSFIDGAGEQLAGNIYDFYPVKEKLYIIKPKENEDLTRGYDFFKLDGHIQSLVLEDIKNIVYISR